MLDAEDRSEELVKGHRSDFKAKQSIAQMPHKSAGTCRLVVQYHFDIPPESLAAYGKAHGRRYSDGVDFGRALLAWLRAENKAPEHDVLELASQRITYEVAK